MATIAWGRVRPLPEDTDATLGRVRRIGVGLGWLGLVVVTIAAVANLAVAASNADRANLAWTFGLNTTGLSLIKLGIAVTLWSILMRLWRRAEAMQSALRRLVRAGDQAATEGERRTPYGTVTVTTTPPGDLPIHRMAKAMWAPMLGMGAMAVVIGLIVSFAWASGGGVIAASWTQGLQFLGEGMILSGISFLLGTILWGIRTAGGEVQASLGVPVHTMVMPTTAKIFVALMMLGLMVSVLQFVLYLVVAAGGADPLVWFSWLGPLRELGLGLILAGIVGALGAIGNALGFQFARVAELVDTERR